MKTIGVAVSAAFAMLTALAVPAAAAPTNGYTSAAVNQRTGPGVEFAKIQVIPAGALVQIYGCLTGLTWCDTLYAGKRGWVSGHYLTIVDQGHRRPVVTFGFAFGLPLIEPWWDFPGHWPPPPRPPKHGGGGPPPPPPPGPPPHHEPGPSNGGPQCGVPGKPPCSGPGSGPGDHSPRDRGPECGVPGKPPCGPASGGPGAGGPPRSGADNAPQCGVPGKPPCHDTSSFGQGNLGRQDSDDHRNRYDGN
jgi:uncharacterized protein YraI